MSLVRGRLDPGGTPYTAQRVLPMGIWLAMVTAPAPDTNFGFAWIAFALTIGIHAADEAAHDFLATYNPNALAIRQRLHLPVPVFTRRAFAVALGSAVGLLLVLSPFAFQGAQWLRIAAVPLAILAGLVNACLHVGGSFFYRRPLAGILSSPLLVAAGVWLLWTCQAL